MEGLEISVVKFSEMKNENGELRIDSNFFLKRYLSEKNNLLNKKITKLGNIAFVTDGQHGYYERDEKSKIHMLAARNCKNFFADLMDAEPLAKWVDDKNKRSSLQEKDIVLSTRGTVGFCAIVLEDVLPANINQDVARIQLLTNDIIPEFLIIYLNCKYGQDWMIKNQTGMVQQGISLDKVRRIPIPIFSDTFQSKIESLVKSAHAKLEESKSLYSQAEDLLLGELGLKDWQPKNTLHTTKKFSDFAQSGRLDAEYYQPKYDEIEKELSRFEQIKIKDFINYPVSSGSTPKAGDSQYYADCNDGIPFLRAVDIVESRIDTNDLIYIKKDVHNELLKRTQLKKGDVLFSIAGTVGRCGIFDYDFEANINQAIAILRFDETKLKHLYVVQFFNSRIGQLIIQKYARQGLQTNLNLDELSNLPIPILPEQIQKKIASLIQQSFECKAQSKQLLEDAKRMVESEIEKN